MADTQVKICCISSAEEAALAMAYGASALGLVSEMPSGPGVIDDTMIAEIAAGVQRPTETFLLTSRTEPAQIAEHVEACRTTTVQIVQHIDPQAYNQLRALLPTQTIVQVVHVEDEQAIDLAARYDGLADRLLLDSGRPSASTVELGGTGRTHDWTVSAEIVRRCNRPVYLAGGLRPDNVAEAIRTVQPYGLDLCSGLRRGGALAEDLVSAFMAAVRNA